MSTAMVLERAREMAEDVAEAVLGEEKLRRELRPRSGSLLNRRFCRRGSGGARRRRILRGFGVEGGETTPRVRVRV